MPQTTPAWLTILVAVLGILGTAVGAIVSARITQNRADARETTQWHRSTWRQTQEWQRADWMALLTQRKIVYGKLIDELRRAQEQLDRRILEHHDLPANWLDELTKTLAQVDLWGSYQVQSRAWDLHGSLKEAALLSTAMRLEQGRAAATVRDQLGACIGNARWELGIHYI